METQAYQINLGHGYRCHENKEVYFPQKETKYQHEDEWYDAVIYGKIGSDEVFVRSLPDFLEKFDELSEEEMFEMFNPNLDTVKPAMRVVSRSFGEGVIIDVSKDIRDLYPVKAKFKVKVDLMGRVRSKIIGFTSLGHCEEHKNFSYIDASYKKK